MPADLIYIIYERSRTRRRILKLILTSSATGCVPSIPRQMSVKRLRLAFDSSSSLRLVAIRSSSSWKASTIAEAAGRLPPPRWSSHMLRLLQVFQIPSSWNWLYGSFFHKMIPCLQVLCWSSPHSKLPRARRTRSTVVVLVAAGARSPSLALDIFRSLGLSFFVCRLLH